MSKLKAIKTCQCGCGTPITGKTKAKYANQAHRQKASRERRGLRNTSGHYCECGCGMWVVSIRAKFYSNACRQRDYRKRQDEAEVNAPVLPIHTTQPKPPARERRRNLIS